MLICKVNEKYLCNFGACFVTCTCKRNKSSFIFKGSVFNQKKNCKFLRKKKFIDKRTGDGDHIPWAATS